MKLELSVFDRLILLNIAPSIFDIDYSIYNVFHKFLNDVSFTDDEHKKIHLIHDEDGEVKWKNDFNKEIEISDKVISLLKARFEIAMSTIEFSDSQKEVYEKIISKL